MCHRLNLGGQNGVANLVRSASLTNYADIARKFRLDPYRLLSEFGLPQRCLREPELKVPMDPGRGLLEAFAERSGPLAVGVVMAETRRLSNVGPLRMLARAKPTLRAALEALADYTGRLNAALFLTIQEAGDVVVLREQFIL